MSEDSAGGSYSAAIREIRKLVADQLPRYGLAGVSIALVDDQTVVFAGGVGHADETHRTPAGADTVYRCGSISKLFNALAVMQLVEQGRLDLDAPITRYNPDFAIVVPFADAAGITLRQLLCHRSGMIREAPVGGYFDDTEPTIEQTVRGLASCVLVNPPNTKTCYSNVGPTIAGHIVSIVSGLPYEDYQQRFILGPMGMTSSAFLATPAVKTAAARGYMPVVQLDGSFRRDQAPLFELGTPPAGNLYTSVSDLTCLAMLLFADGRIGDKRIVSPETLAEMLRPQLVSDPIGFGLGFNVGKLGEHKMVSHTGAVYGFTSYFAALPDAKLAAIVLINEDLVVGPVRKMTETALELLLEAKLGEKPAPQPAATLTPEQLARLAGEYESTSYWAKLTVSDGRLQAIVSGQSLTLTPTEPLKFTAEGRWQWRSEFVFTEDADGRVNEFQAITQKFRRVDPAAAPTSPAAWRKYLGSYGLSYIPVIVSIRHGHLYAFIENMVDYRLIPMNRTVFAMPPGLYTDEQLVFQVAPDGEVYGLTLANVDLKRIG